MLLRIVLISCVLTLWALTGQAVVLKSPKGLHYMGVGYNLLEGNPEGGQVSSGGVDPGLLFTRKIFKLTWNTNKVSMDKTTSLPDQVSFAPRQSCVKTNQKEVVTGSKSYQEKLNVDVQASGGYNNLLFGVAFSVSGRFEKMQKETSKYHNVFYEEKHVCNRGRARYQLDLAAVKGYPVSNDFASAVCSLPSSYDDKKYYNFIERWGTHIVVEADLGTRTIEQFRSSQAEFTSYAMENVGSAVSVSGSYKGYSASLQVDVKKFKESMSDKTKFGENKQVLTSGGDDLPEPIAIKLVPIDVAIQMTFFSSLGNMTAHRAIGCFFTAAMLASKRAAVQRALVDYPKKKGAINPVDPPVRIPLTWPKGTYGLPMPKVGCPKDPGFTWHQGTRLHDTENTFPSNGCSQTYSLAGKNSRNDMEQKFCMKTQEMSNKYDLLWPKGQYCIFKKGACPKGLNEGYIRWDDENVKNHNSYSGALPDGQYDRNTLIRYCCRTDGYATNEIILPADKPFFLFKSNTHQCQKVRGMRVTGEFFSWDCNDLFPQNKFGGYKPYASIGKNIKIDYCYYTPKAS